MGITVHIYNTPTAPEHLYKDITTVISPAAGYTGDVRGDISVDAPVILIQATILSGNYVYIPEFGRYYWITDRNIERTDLTELTLRSDPLMSFASSIVNLPIQVTRAQLQPAEGSTAGYDVYIADGKMQTEARKIYIRYEDPSFDFTYPDEANSATYQYVLGVIG